MGLHKFHSEATKKKISESLKNSPNKRGRFQKGHKINLGRKISDETKAKMSKAHKGVKKSKQHRENIRKSKIREKSKWWNGGKTKDKFGYIHIYNPEHPHAVNKYVLEHRLIMESHIGRTLYKKEVVHHINKIKDDNRIENLLLFENNKEHLLHHRLI